MTDVLHLDINAGRITQTEIDRNIQEISDIWHGLSREIYQLTSSDWQGPAAREFFDQFGEYYNHEKQQLLEFERLSRALRQLIDDWEETDRVFRY